jgi:hypothetical protein
VWSKNRGHSLEFLCPQTFLLNFLFFYQFLSCLYSSNPSYSSQNVKSIHLSKIQAFLESLELFTLIPSSITMEITTKCQTKKYPTNTIILRQGDEASAMYFIRSGKCKVIRILSFKLNPITKQKLHFDCEDPN